MSKPYASYSLLLELLQHVVSIITKHECIIGYELTPAFVLVR